MINEIISIVTVILILIFSIFLKSISEWNKLNIKILFLFLVVNANYIIAYLFNSQIHPATIISTSIFYILHTAGFLFGPLLYLYVRTSVFDINHLTKKDLYNIIPFVIAAVYILTRILLLFIENKIWLTKQEYFIYQFLFHLTVLCYMLFAINEMAKYRAKIKNYYSLLDVTKLSWLALVLFGYLFMWLIDFVHFFAGNFSVLNPDLESFLITLSLTINLLFAVLIFYKGIKQPQLFHSIISSDQKLRYEKSTLTENQAEIYLEHLKNFMEKEKPYLKPDLTIIELAEMIGIPSRFISQIINEYLHKNFYEFISSYRIEESKKYLSDLNQNKKTILEILYDAGFNSKSAFNKAFKDYTGVTPTQFRRLGR